MNNQKQLRKYASNFIDHFLPHLQKGFNVEAKIYPAYQEGAIIEFFIKSNVRKNIDVVNPVQRINNTLEKIDQRLIGGDIRNVTFRGTNVYMEGDRIVIIKGEDGHQHWSNAAAKDDVERVVFPNKERR